MRSACSGGSEQTKRTSIGHQTTGPRHPPITRRGIRRVRRQKKTHRCLFPITNFRVSVYGFRPARARNQQSRQAQRAQPLRRLTFRRQNPLPRNRPMPIKMETTTVRLSHVGRMQAESREKLSARWVRAKDTRGDREQKFTIVEPRPQKSSGSLRSSVGLRHFFTSDREGGQSSDLIQNRFESLFEFGDVRVAPITPPTLRTPLKVVVVQTSQRFQTVDHGFFGDSG